MIQLFRGLPEGQVSTSLDAWGLLKVKKWRGVACCCIRGTAILQLRPSQLSTNRMCWTCDFPWSGRKRFNCASRTPTFQTAAKGLLSVSSVLGSWWGRAWFGCLWVPKTKESGADCSCSTKKPTMPQIDTEGTRDDEQRGKTVRCLLFGNYTYNTQKVTSPPKKFQRPQESVVGLIGEGLSLYKAST